MLAKLKKIRLFRIKRINTKHIVIYLLLVIYCAFTIFAFTWIGSVSLKTNKEFFISPPWSLPKAPQFKNYVIAWNRGIGNMFKNSLFVAVTGAILSVGLSCFAAYPIARIPFKINQVVLTFFLLGMMVPYILTAIPVYFMISRVQRVISLDPRIILIILYMASGFSFNTFVLTGTFRTLPDEFEEAAAIDGATPLQTFFRIMLPLAKPGLVATFIFNYLSLWNEFFYALIFIKNKSEQTISLGLVYLDQQATYTARWVNLFAGAVISIVPVLLIFALLQDQVAKGLTVGGIKG